MIPICKMATFKFFLVYTLAFLDAFVLCSAQVGTFWQITDIHLEVNYSRSGDIHDDCRGNNISKKELGEFGDFFCDSPLKLVEDALNNMKRIQPNPDFILWTGDSFPHLDDDESDWYMMLSTIDELTSLITSAFPNTPVIPIIGNHDVYPTKNFPWYDFNNYASDFLEKAGWSKLIPHDQHDNFKKGGYFSMFIHPKTTILGLNTFLYAEDHPEHDPQDQLAWFAQQLQNAEENNHSVIVTSHIPPVSGTGHKEMLPAPQTTDYQNIILNYSHVISAQVYGHLHSDLFSVWYDGNGVLKSSAFMAPSITPWKYPRNAVRGNNPGVRLYHYDQSSGEILDYDQHSLDLLEANKNAGEGNDPQPWKLLYSAAELYGVSNLNVTSMGEIYQKISCNDTIFDVYFKMFNGGVEQNCDNACKKIFRCGIISVTASLWNNCVSSEETFIKNC